METKFTKGPWRVLNGKYSLTIFSEKHWIANIKCESCPAHEDANAALIAAAPELYEALKNLVAWKEATEIIAPELGGLLSAFYHAEAVLSKARGEQS